MAGAFGTIPVGLIVRVVRLDLVEPHRLRYAWNLVQGSGTKPGGET